MPDRQKPRRGLPDAAFVCPVTGPWQMMGANAAAACDWLPLRMVINVPEFVSWGRIDSGL
ncbi:hypothetical protein GCM10007920_41840 [Ciceribacter naphthalenivorans]|uniref:Uncharacterized protein n=1 Tax=Sphingomonas psychrolutea TaxID=1259676 RepID=A0ABQ6EHG0_9SPHN|nr:hypothetical protein GCM10007920_41840 [Ciceribacter naphthalenivorans]GLT07246.1 hypothetical protein GCM10007926_41840 [Sphingomonas psychrolutea]